MASISAFDDRFWCLDILLTWLRRRAGVPNDDEAIAKYQVKALAEITERASTSGLEITGRRCRLEFPDRIATTGVQREVIPVYEFMDGNIWAFRGVYVLTPCAWVPNAKGLASLPEDFRQRVTSLISARFTFRWTEAGDALDGWRDLLVRADQVRTVWGDPKPELEPSGSSLCAEINRHEAVSRGQPRAAYRGALEAWMAEKKLSILQKMGPTAIARAFKTHCEQHLPELAPLLPKRPRSMEGPVERIIKRRLEALRTKNRGSKSTGNGQ